jgi:GNAT superfamily N-acetyltransferase
MHIALAEARADIERCFPVMAELRPHLHAEEFVSRILRMQPTGYHLAYLADDADVFCAVAGFWLRENLAWGKHVYLDDLVTASARRSAGWGGRLFDWVAEYGRAHGCAELHLDSGVQRYGAHRFYLCRRMDITSHHFAMKLA